MKIQSIGGWFCHAICVCTAPSLSGPHECVGVLHALAVVSCDTCLMYVWWRGAAVICMCAPLHRHLNLSNNQLNGDIPAALGSLGSMRYVATFCVCIATCGRVCVSVMFLRFECGICGV